MPDAPGPNVPFPPMEAELVSELPEQGAWRYEPKWDGFRGVFENAGPELAEAPLRPGQIGRSSCRVRV